MAIVSSGAISIASIVNEFGGAAPHSLSEYYRNGPYVGSNNTSVPTSGAIRLSNFYGATAGTTVTVTEGNGAAAIYHVANGFWLLNKAVIFGNGFSADAALAAAKGSRTPTTLNGVTIEGIHESYYSKTPEYRFNVVLQGTRAKNFFTSVTPQGGTGALATSGATWTHLASSTIWSWVIADYATWDGTGTRTATFI